MAKRNPSNDLRLYKREAVAAARDLCYPPEVVEKIKAAQTEAEVINILCSARQKMN